MAAVPDKILTWQMVQPTTRDKETGEVVPGKIEKTEIDINHSKSYSASTFSSLSAGLYSISNINPLE